MSEGRGTPLILYLKYFSITESVAGGLSRTHTFYLIRSPWGRKTVEKDGYFTVETVKMAMVIIRRT